MPKKKLLILGAGGFGQAVAEVATLLEKWSDIDFVDDRWPELAHVKTYSVISNLKNLDLIDLENYEAIVAVGNNQLRYQWYTILEQLNVSLTTIIHPSVIKSITSIIDLGVIIMAGCILGTATRIEKGVILNIGTLLDHDVIIKSYSHLSVGVGVAAGQTIKEFSFLDVGTKVGH